jgi:7-carboxy-7-deazaguanine synthase (Cx14CxxC type)
MYALKEIFRTLQGEGAQAGRAAVFCRFAGCNLWSGREIAREAATCRFCDTDFVGANGPGGGQFAPPRDLAEVIETAWGAEPNRRFVVFTGGKPLLQLDAEILSAVRARGFETAVETNGTKYVPLGLDWVCVSPKACAPLRVREGDEIKLVFPQDGIDPAAMVELGFRHLWLQPMDGATLEANTAAAVRYCPDHPRWRLGLQTHKFIGIP